MPNPFGISQICPNMVLYAAVVDCFDANTHRPFCLKSTSQCDSIMLHGGKHLRPLKNRLEKLGNINFIDFESRVI